MALIYRFLLTVLVETLSAIGRNVLAAVAAAVVAGLLRGLAEGVRQGVARAVREARGRRT
jgi:hypothetical protein